uniref:Uncharacterized protein n=1 Tax=Echinococcus canadensis TaxID=519352 RepID=A0A915EU74_9CEST
IYQPILDPCIHQSRIHPPFHSAIRPFGIYPSLEVIQRGCAKLKELVLVWSSFSGTYYQTETHGASAALKYGCLFGDT